MSIINNSQQTKFIIKPSKFRIESLGEEYAYQQIYNPNFPQRRYYFDSADYFLEQYRQEEKKRQEQAIEAQILALIQEQSLNMEEKYGAINRRILIEKNAKKEKKQFDSADYFMALWDGKNKRTIDPHLEFEKFLDETIKQQQEELETRYVCKDLKKRPILINKQKKYFDSADYFLELYKNTIKEEDQE